MFEIRTEMEFSAAHFHPDYPGKCSRLHGHNYKVVVYVRAEELDKYGMVCDFFDIKGAVSKLIEQVDHTLLNEHNYFKDRHPSAENIAEFFFNEIKEPLTKDNHWLHAVEIWENNRSAARFIKN